ncbi:hypothetical protein K2173_011917 [Erythroxylum novogranatense]|uniref:Pentatricopeptide repeat-containing protein n=1 Tax=Erythroxylum novogranatense TaxID=1862640 RepID=A0AAV8TEE0_9ROSI|nr:hypothetical protein K2173_011917 [Erythroxylum novogranatense]
MGLLVCHLARLKFGFQSKLIQTPFFLLHVHTFLFPNYPIPTQLQLQIKACHSVVDPVSQSATQHDPLEESALQVQNILKVHRDSPMRRIELALDYCSVTITEDLVLNVLKRHSSDWKPAFIFFSWVSKGTRVSLGSSVYNKVLDILGRMKRFQELNQVLDEMSNREGLVDGETYRVLLHRYAAAHKVDEAIGVFNMMRHLGLEPDLDAFQKLLMYLCRYKQVEVAETLLHSKGAEFGVDIKTMNIVLNGWCVLGNVQEAKRFWRDIIASKCKPDFFTYGTFINALTKKGKIGTAMKLYRAMWKNHVKMDVVVCNCVIDALCFKKRVPEALETFQEMKERGSFPNSATYNTLIKHLCKIRRMEKVYELLGEMEVSESCVPNEVTFNYLLKSLKRPEEVGGILERMERNRCKVNGDAFNLILKLYVDWDCEERVRHTWDEMEKHGLGPDSRSYTIIIHWLLDKGRNEDALHYFRDMTSKGMMIEPRTQNWVNQMTVKPKENRS